MSRERFTVAPTGVGRSDYSQDIQAAVEPLTRSHQQRVSWSARYLLPPYLFGEGYWAAPLTFEDEEGTSQLYVPEAPKYCLYDFSTQVSQNALMENGLAKIEKIEAITDPTVIVENIFKVYGYGKSSIRLTKGYICEPGYSYIVYITCYTEQPSYYVTTNVMGIDDTRVEGS